ncbi:DUF2827 domain-containing protein [Noviherbaspirillum galbum]|uniref:DUF2827 domain-containing protein n=1 Tax=Noviherbaspirillum galbum TaxID=2709383 RepID=A0A6B3SLF1_9BURK|nr:DUF2827 domain-containing protein [Noviherbaspirillum galbum]NEX61664.1 DUF2827 domain-containing protein [Noviherbaspirillum galbum]
MRIGLSVISREGDSIWSNGLGQNVIFLAQLLRRIPFVSAVVLVDVGVSGSMPAQLNLRGLDLELVPFQAANDRIDLIIEMAGGLDPCWLDRFRACGGKAVYYCAGQPYVGLIEPVLFSDKGFSHRPDRMDEVWLLPKDDSRFAPMMRTLHRCPMHEVPYLWSPLFVQQRSEDIGRQGYHFGYRARSGRDAQPSAWRAAILEPNISVIKSACLPMLICDEAARSEPGAINALHVLNSLHLKDHPTMLHLANSLDLVRNGKALFHGRHDIAGFMAQYADVIVSHQWQNDQNYLYLDALWGNLPLIHNSPWLRDAGYYYPEFDVPSGARQLLHAWRNHEEDLPAYRTRARTVFAQVDPASMVNVQAYAHRLLALFQGRLPAEGVKS